MTTQPIDRPSRVARLRLWPGVALVLVQWTAFFLLPVAFPAAKIAAVLIGLACGPLVLVWWLLASRAPWIERLGAIAVTAAGFALARQALHPSVAEGNVGLQYYLYTLPIVSLALVAWAVATRRLAVGPRRVAGVATLLAACGFLVLLRNDGLLGDGTPQFSWRWSATAEDRLLAAAGDPSGGLSGDTAGLPDTPPTEAQWPGFYGPGRDGVLAGVRLSTDWTSAPPVELWRRRVGPGTSSFAVGGGRLYTQEQRGDSEVVAAYDLDTGEPAWRHEDTARHEDPYVGAGPRATPTLAGGRIYSVGATGIVNALDARDGRLLWSHQPSPGAKVPIWGYTGSPLVVDDLVIAYTEALVAYDRATGVPRWSAPEVGGSYDSASLLEIDGAAQVVLQRNAGATGYALADGAKLWEHPWRGIGILPPIPIAPGELLVAAINEGAMPMGVRRIAVERRGVEWTVAERWASERLRPSFSSVAVHRGYAFGVDRGLLAAIDLADGERRWKGGRYGEAQVLLLPDQDLLLVLSERGEIVLVEALPDGFTEVARFAAIEGKTWSQPALVGDVLLVRNAREMAAFKLQLATR